ncbi:SFRP2 protein, partial [Nothoprocta ornata]|nr:SFRP2 protein [Nothoprocta ornata]
ALSLSSFLGRARGFDIGLSTKCVAIPQEMAMCQKIGYSEMRLPNLLGHTSLEEVVLRAAAWQRLARTDCHPLVRTFLCSLFAPVCLDTFIQPCRSVCAAVWERCAPLLACHGRRWPRALDCERFPAGEDRCLASLAKEHGHPHKVLPKPACQSCPAVEEFFMHKRALEVVCDNNFAVKVKLSKKRTVLGHQDFNFECQVEFIIQGSLLPYEMQNMIQQWLLINENCTERMLQPHRPMVYLLVGNIEDGVVLVNNIYRWHKRDSHLTLATHKGRYHKCL